MRTLKFLPILIIFLTAPPLASGQQLFFKTYTAADGLPTSAVSTVFQDSGGYIWVGTREGVARYDGDSFRVFTESDSLLGPHVSRIYEDSRGRIWMAVLRSGISRWDGAQFSNFTVADSLINRSPTCFLETTGGDIYIATFGGVSVFRDSTFVRHFSFSDDFLKRVVTHILVDENNTMWFATWDGLIKAEADRFVNVTEQARLGSIRIENMMIDRAGRFWLGTATQGALVFDGHQFSHWSMAEGLAGNVIYSIIEDQRGRIWLATDEGVGIIEDQQITTLTTKNGLPTNKVFELMEDREGTIWFATSLGLVKLLSESFGNYPKGIETIPATPFSITGTADNTIYVATANGLYQIMGPAVFPYPHNHRLLSQRVNSLATAGDQTIWGGMEMANKNAAFRISGQRLQNYTLDHGSFPIIYTYDILVDRDQTVWFVGNTGVHTFKNNRIDEELYGHFGSTINCAVQDSAGFLWFGTQDYGLVKWVEKDSTRHYTTADGLPSNQITDLHVDAAGRMWIATSQGLCYYQHDHFIHFNLVDEIAKKNIKFVITDHEQRLYIGTNKGISVFTNKGYYSYTQKTGLVGNECVARCCYLAPDGRLWFGTTNGISVFDPAKTRSILERPPVKLQYVDIKDHRFDPDSISVLAYHQNSFNFRFTALSYADETDVRFQCRLVGLDANWQEIGASREIRYTNLDPGHYNFQVKAINRDGVISREPAEVRFTITAPFWERWWFILIGSGLVLTIGGMVMNRVFQRRANRIRILSELDAARKFQLNLLPNNDPRLTKLEISGISIPATEVGGDYFDYFPLPGQKLGFAIGDVTGHGISSGILMAMAKGGLVHQTKLGLQPSQVMQAMNNIILASAEKKMFMTFLYLIIDEAKLTLTYSNAGHPFPLHYIAAEDRVDELDLTSLPLGVLADIEFGQLSVDLGPGDLVIFYTDGLIEARDRDGKFFQLERVTKFLKQNHRRKPGEIKIGLLEQANHFCHGHPDDDITIVVLKVND